MHVGFVQLLPLPCHATGQAQQAEQLAGQHTQATGALAAELALEPGMLALGIYRDDAPERLQQPLAPRRPPLQRGGGRLHPALPGGACLLHHHLLDPLRPEHGADRHGAEDAEADLGAARHRLVEHQQGLADDRQADDRHRVARQHEGVGPGAAQQGRGRRTQAQPQRHHQQEQPGRLGEQAHEQHRQRRADQRPEQPRQALLHHHARQRLGDDKGRHQRPLRLVEVEAEGAPQRQAAAEQGLAGELQRREAGGQEGRQGITHGSATDGGIGNQGSRPRPEQLNHQS